jgi:hypothetical protein
MRTPPHPLQEALRARVGLLATTLRPSTVQHYEQTARLFLAYLRHRFPAVRRPSQLRRDPHMLGWLEHLWMRRVERPSPVSSIPTAAYLVRARTAFIITSQT